VLVYAIFSSYRCNYHAEKLEMLGSLTEGEGTQDKKPD
jgi:hypothetical protein